MKRIEEIFVSLFSILREELREESGVGLALKAEGQYLTLRVRRQKTTEDEKQPYFSVVVGERDGAFRISYDPSGLPMAERQVTIVGAESAEELVGLVRGYVEVERRRMVGSRQGS